MAFSGYLIKVGDYDTFFNSFIKASSYKVTKKILDVDSYRDANGILHRNTVPHSSYTIELEVKPLDNTRVQTLLTALRSNFTTPAERKLSLTFYLPESDSYETANVYMPDIDFPINHIEGTIIKYNSFNLKFIGY